MAEAPEDKKEIFTEQEALNAAADEGIYFTDKFGILEVATLNEVAGPFKTRAEAGDALKKLGNVNQYTITQTRERSQSIE